MAFTTSDRLTGPIFEIQASQELKSFFAHASILSQSDTLKALVEGGWKDSVNRTIKLPEWDADTVGRLLEWLYMGDYHSPLPESPPSSRIDQQKQVVSQNNQELTAGEIAIIEDFGKDITIGAGNLNAQPEQQLVPISDQHFGEHQYEHRHFSLEHLSHWGQDCTFANRNLFFESLFVHAKVYCLANYMLLPGLQALAFDNLKQLLLLLEPLKPKAPAVSTLVNLVKYVYANTNRPQKGEEPLQRLLTTFIAQNASSFIDNKRSLEVRRLMEEGGDFTVDVWAKASTRIGWLEFTMEDLKIELMKTKDEVRRLTRKKKKGWVGEDGLLG